ncbi:hypothetical protein Micbo1qcDRAFT_173414 [Microdochium bolleyi]|uniref:Uncharacterized protein n=1 Tax=Microdochium bolleyi TaxID=196109 RepID=A0A136JBT0_9PEZI|nr:hypothetical protein Micbo1qcDRAFT_173414 [Microdochium bolleyi]
MTRVSGFGHVIASCNLITRQAVEAVSWATVRAVSRTLPWRKYHEPQARDQSKETALPGLRRITCSAAPRTQQGTRLSLRISHHRIVVITTLTMQGPGAKSRNNLKPEHICTPLGSKPASCRSMDTLVTSPCKVRCGERSSPRGLAQLAWYGGSLSLLSMLPRPLARVHGRISSPPDPCIICAKSYPIHKSTCNLSSFSYLRVASNQEPSHQPETMCARYQNDSSHGNLIVVSSAMIRSSSVTTAPCSELLRLCSKMRTRIRQASSTPYVDTTQFFGRVSVFTAVGGDHSSWMRTALAGTLGRNAASPERKAVKPAGSCYQAEAEWPIGNSQSRAGQSDDEEVPARDDVRAPTMGQDS